MIQNPTCLTEIYELGVCNVQKKGGWGGSGGGLWVYHGSSYSMSLEVPAVALISSSSGGIKEESGSCHRPFRPPAVCPANICKGAVCLPWQGPPSKMMSSMAMSLLSDRPLVASNTIWNKKKGKTSHVFISVHFTEHCCGE